MANATTATSTPVQAEAAAQQADESAPEHEDLLVEELLVEEVSIDGMCGVY